MRRLHPRPVAARAGHPAGNLYAVVQLITPRELDARSRELFEELARCDNAGVTMGISVHTDMATPPVFVTWIWYRIGSPTPFPPPGNVCVFTALNDIDGANTTKPVGIDATLVDGTHAVCATAYAVFEIAVSKQICPTVPLISNVATVPGRNGVLVDQL